MSIVLKKSFYKRDTETVAQELLGKYLVRVLEDGRSFEGMIVETEAYLGAKDPAAHTFGGRRTPRNEVMYGEGGFAYIYFIYGIHYCFNAVTRTMDEPEAVLIRALDCSPLPHKLANGPGKLCKAFSINRELNGISLQSPPLRIEDRGIEVPKSRLIAKPRIGVDYAGYAARWKLRYYIKGNLSVSKP